MDYDIVIVGGGMAGISLAASLPGGLRTLVVEAEHQLGFHATGRSAALSAPGYGNRAIRQLTAASRDSLFGADPTVPSFVTPRRVVVVATATQQTALAARLAAEPAIYEALTGPALEKMVPILRPGAIVGGLLERDAADIDVDALLQFYVRGFKAAGGTIHTGAGVTALSAEAGRWRVEMGGSAVYGRILVNAAGAWADELAAMAGVPTLGLKPKRRTAALIDAPEFADFADWPTVIDVDERFYFKPDAGKLLVSPADETDVAPHDAYADDEILAEGIDRIMALTTIEVKRVPRVWAGLRTFTADRTPVIGFDAGAEAPLFWLAGQGGYGIQTAPAMARLAAALVQHACPPGFATPDLVEALSPDRFR